MPNILLALTYIISFNFKVHWEIGMVITILKMRKLRFRHTLPLTSKQIVGFKHIA